MLPLIISIIALLISNKNKANTEKYNETSYYTKGQIDSLFKNDITKSQYDSTDIKPNI